MENKQQDKEEGHNTIACGELTISSSILTMNEVLGVLDFLLKDKKVMDYLTQYKKRKLIESSGASYV